VLFDEPLELEEALSERLKSKTTSQEDFTDPNVSSDCKIFEIAIADIQYDSIIVVFPPENDIK
jgi:hypothetical protein